MEITAATKISTIMVAQINSNLCLRTNFRIKTTTSTWWCNKCLQLKWSNNSIQCKWQVLFNNNQTTTNKCHNQPMPEVLIRTMVEMVVRTKVLELTRIKTNSNRTWEWWEWTCHQLTHNKCWWCNNMLSNKQFSNNKLRPRWLVLLTMVSIRLCNWCKWIKLQTQFNLFKMPLSY